MKIKLAYSPDTDDAFMVLALKHGFVDHQPYEFEFTSADIQTLNAAAHEKVYDITAISVAAYPNIAGDYEMMPCGASVGQKFGPVVVVAEASHLSTISQLQAKRIAVPGLQTSALFAAKALLPDFEAVPMAFHEIRNAILSGDCDAGILIHELQLNFAEFGLRRIDDLGRLWYLKYNLPLPLGTNAIRRELGSEHIAALNQIYTASIEWALTHRKEAIAVASQDAFAGLKNPDLADRYISMYVNEDSLQLNADVRQAINLLLREGAARGLCPAITETF